MTVLFSPIFQPDSAQIDANGDPRSGAKLFTYLATTSTKATTYQDSAGSVAHTNPIVLDSNGLPPAPIWLTTGSSYKFVLAPANDTDPPASALETIDNVAAVNDTAAAATSTEWTASGMSGLTYISATSFRVSGDQTTTLHVGRRLKTTNTGGTVYATIIRSTYSDPNTTVTVLTDSGSLDSGFTGAGNLSYGIVSADNTSAPFISRDQQCGRLVYVSATQIRLDPQDGNTIWVYSGSNWRRRIIPSAGITMANTGIAANFAGYIYLYDNAGVLTMESSLTVPAVDASSGLKIKTGDATRLLVGMVKCTSATPGQFQTPALVLSWYKRRGIKVISTFSANQTTASASLVELEVAARVNFLSWAEEDIHAEYAGYGSGDTAGESETTAITLDGIGTTIATMFVTTPVAGYASNYSFGGCATVTEGHHYATIAAAANAPTGTWNAGKLFVLTQG